MKTLHCIHRALQYKHCKRQLYTFYFLCYILISIIQLPLECLKLLDFYDIITTKWIAIDILIMCMCTLNSRLYPQLKIVLVGIIQRLEQPVSEKKCDCRNKKRVIT